MNGFGLTHLSRSRLTIHNLPVIHFSFGNNTQSTIADPSPESHIFVHEVGTKLGFGPEVEHLELSTGCTRVSLLFSFPQIVDPPLRAKIFSFALGFMMAESAVIGRLTTSPASFKLIITT